jgi:UbiD family decarboxylase
VNLGELPMVMNNPNDGGFYITAGHVIMKDSELGYNLAIYRMMHHSRNEVFIRLVPGHHGWVFVKKAEERQANSLQIAVAIGVDPAIYIASQFVPKLGVNEVEIAGGLRKKPVDVVKCKTIDIEVPAYAEIILEGEMKIPPKTGTEGPFGEFTGYTSGIVENERIMTIKAITHKKNPIYQNIWLGRPPHEHLYINAMTYAVPVYHDLKPRFPAVKATYAPPSGVSMKLIIQIDGKLKYPGMVNDLLASSISTGLWKEIIAVDEDINLFDSDEVDWAIVTRVQPDRDIFILPGGHGIYLDPSSVSEGISAKLFIDATMKKGFRGKVVEPTQEMMEKIETKWKEYGFKS